MEGERQQAVTMISTAVVNAHLCAGRAVDGAQLGVTVSDVEIRPILSTRPKPRRIHKEGPRKRPFFVRAQMARGIAATQAAR